MFPSQFLMLLKLVTLHIWESSRIPMCVGESAMGEPQTPKLRLRSPNLKLLQNLLLFPRPKRSPKQRQCCLRRKLRHQQPLQRRSQHRRRSGEDPEVSCKHLPSKLRSPRRRSPRSRRHPWKNRLQCLMMARTTLRSYRSLRRNGKTLLESPEMLARRS